MGGILHEQRFHLVDEQNFQTGERIGSVAAAHASQQQRDDMTSRHLLLSASPSTSFKPSGDATMMSDVSNGAKSLTFWRLTRMPILKQSSALPAMSSMKSSGRLETRFATATASSCGDMNEAITSDNSMRKRDHNGGRCKVIQIHSNSLKFILFLLLHAVQQAAKQCRVRVRGGGLGTSSTMSNSSKNLS
jgi:hypothetical protein